MKLHFFLSTNSEGGFISRKQDGGGRILTRAAKLTAAGQKTSAVLCSGGVSLCNNDGVFALNLAGCGRLNIFFAFAGFFVKRIPVFKRCFGIGLKLSLMSASFSKKRAKLMVAVFSLPSGSTSVRSKL